MRFFSKRTRNSIITVLTIASATLINIIENTNLNDSSDVLNAESQRNSTAQVAGSEDSDGKDANKQAQATSQENSTAQAADSDGSVEKEVNSLLKSLHEMKKNRDEINDLYRRSLAENQNMGKRYLKQVEEVKLFGIQSFSKDLLDVADVLHKAIESVPKEEVTDNNPHLKSLYEGLTMAESELKTVFTRHGLEFFNPIDEKFNANLHEALFEQEVEGKLPGIVFVVSKQGCKLRGRVIRPALVGVTK